jgi:hypothetical protein
MKSKRSLKVFCACVCFLIGAANVAYCTIDEAHWSIIGPTAITLDWRSTTPSENVMYYGTISGNLPNSVTALAASPTPTDSAGYYWEAKLTGLQTNTLYYYKIGSGGTQHTFRTPLLPGSAGNGGFVVAACSDLQGSTSRNSDTDATNNQIRLASPAFVLVVGDLTGWDEVGIDKVHQRFASMMGWSQDAAYMPIWGNHDWGRISGNPTSGADMDYIKGRVDFPNPQTYPGSLSPGEDWYWFDYGHTRFICYPEPFSGNWTAWISPATTIMDQAQADPNITFIVTYGHRPAYSSGTHAGDSQVKSILDNFADTHSKYVMNISGHTHTIERSIPEMTHGIVHLTDCTVASTMCGGNYSGYDTQTMPSWEAYRGKHFGFYKLVFNKTSIEGSYILGTSYPSYCEDVTGALGTVAPNTAFSIGTVDTDAPTPNPMTWAVSPASASATSITMTATTAADVSDVEYFFQNTSDGMSGHNSGWQTSPTWTDTGLTTGFSYSYQVKARDQSSRHNETAYSDTASATAAEVVPGDLDGNGAVDLVDFAMFAAYWLENDCVTPDWCGGADLTQPADNTVDFQDLEILVGNWLLGL